MTRRPPAPHAVIALAWILACAPATGQAMGTQRIEVEVGSFSRSGVSAEGIEFSVRRDAEGTPSARLRIKRLTIPGLPGPIGDISLDCPGLALQQETLTCQDNAAQLEVPVFGKQSPAIDASYRRTDGKATLALEGFEVTGGELALEAQWHGGEWQLSARARDMDAGSIAALLPDDLIPGWSISGDVHGTLAVDGQWLQMDRIVGDVATSGLTFNDPSGLRAGDGLEAEFSWRARREGRDWIGQSELTADRGQLYIDPVFTDLAKHPITLDGEAVAHPDEGGLELLGLEVEQTGVLTASGVAELSREPPYLASARLHQIEAKLPAAYTTYGQPLLRGTSAGELETNGRFEAALTLRDARLTSLQVTARGISAQDKRGRFELEGITGDIHWSASNNTSPTESVIEWRGGSLYGMGVGDARLRLRADGDDVVLPQGVRIPVLDGALVIKQLAVKDVTEDEPSGVLDARLEAVSLERLTAALDWPRFNGTLSGRLPSLSYEQGVATLGGAFEADVFGGEVAVSELRLRDPLGALPELEASIRLGGINLKPLTSAFEFGRITGSLDGRIEDLRLVGWQPAAFRAWFQTPDDDPRDHRISQRAVENLASIGGGGGAAALSRGFLRFFEDFNYRDLGLGCVLRQDVCVMRGLGEASKGYYIVRGRGVPRVDVIGYVKTVSWPTLVEQIVSATASGGPVVE